MITNVTPTEAAFKEYSTNGYPAIGSDYTDEGEDGYLAVTGGTSSGKPGFFSNADATVSYEWKNTSYEEDYADPVIQVEPITVKKEWSGVADPKDTVLVQLLDQAGNPVDGQILKLSAQNNYTGKVVVEQASNYSGVRELTEVVKGTEGAIAFENKYYAMVEPDGILSFKDYDYQVSYRTEDVDGKTVYHVMNTKDSQNIKILKKQSGSGTSAVYLEGAEFTLTDESGELVKIGANTTGTYRSASDGLLLEGKIAYGTYTLTEVTAPEGYQLLKRPVKLTVDADGISVAYRNQAYVTVNKEEEVYLVSVTNEMLYELPEAGGIGIFWYTIGGCLFMMAAALILYKKRCDALLEK